jgi:hypothetical protein
MKDAATGFGFLAMCGLVSIGLCVGSYAVDVIEYWSTIERKAEVHDEWAVQAQMIAESEPGLKLVAK